MGLFSDSTVTHIACNSEGQIQRSLLGTSIQTESYKVINRGFQVLRTRSESCQTDAFDQDPACQVETENDLERLIHFLKRTEPILTEQIEKNCRSREFGRKTTEAPITVSLQLSSTIKPEIANIDGLSPTCFTWNCTGAVLGITYGCLRHNGWCTHEGVLVLWNITQMDGRRLSKKLEANSCYTAASFHPSALSVLAAGTFAGELLVYNFAKDSESLIASNSSDDGSYTESIIQIEWLLDRRGTDKSSEVTRHLTDRILTIGTDGRIAFWALDLHGRDVRMRCVKLIQFSNRDMMVQMGPAYTRSGVRKSSRSSSLGYAHNQLPCGFTAAAISPFQPDRLAIGTEAGGIFLCDLGTAAYSTESTNPPMITKGSAVVEFCLFRQSGPVSGLTWSKFDPNLLISCGNRSIVQVHNIKERSQPITIDPGQGAVTVIQLSPHYPNLLTCCTGQGSIALYEIDTRRGAFGSAENSPEKQPRLLHIVSGTDENGARSMAPIVALTFNPRNAKLLATGDQDGRVCLWELEELWNER
ncbi:unnamed protein product [Dicrocoelium dendriticum]|nr:unnamed protein product [Dicrocoelium dendriticum]